MNLTSAVIHDLCVRNYGLRLVKNRKQMHLHPDVLQAFTANQVFLQWIGSSPYDTGIQYSIESQQ